ncbi:MAG: ABC transporter permease subunit [Myxococcales bacterium]|nr:ABC transporter permease subunit [Myxococcales bacterium]
MSEAKVPGGSAYAPTSHGAVMAIARLTLTRFLRSKTIYVAAFFAAIPLFPLLVRIRYIENPADAWDGFVKLTAYIQLLVMSLLAAPAIAEEIEDKTYTYLWSRPIPRWTILAGKLLIGGLVGIVLMAACLALGSQIAQVSDPGAITSAIMAMGLGVVATGCIASCLGTLMPKHALAVCLAYFMVLDLSIGAMPFAAARISVMHNVVAIAGVGADQDTFATSLLWLLGLSVFWTSITIWRLGRKELSTGS